MSVPEDIGVHSNTVDLNILVRVKIEGVKKGLLPQVVPVQGEPFIWGVEITNISDVASPQMEISNAALHSLDKNYFVNADKQISVRPLNPGESLYVEVDRVTAFIEGVVWAKAKLSSSSSVYDIAPFQIDTNHDVRSRCHLDEENDTNWVEDIYLHKKSEVLQSRTNNLIVVLTVITVVEAVFGIKKCLVFFVWVLAESFGYFSSLFSWLSKTLS